MYYYNVFLFHIDFTFTELIIHTYKLLHTVLALTNHVKDKDTIVSFFFFMFVYIAPEGYRKVFPFFMALSYFVFKFVLSS